MWSAWFMRFAAERGLYAIYTNFPNEQSFIVNYRDKVWWPPRRVQTPALCSKHACLHCVSLRIAFENTGRQL